MTNRVIRALALGLVFLWACSPPPPRKSHGPDATLLEGARLRLEELQTRRRRILAWYELAEGAAPAFPDLAARFQARALDLTSGLLDPQADSLARMLRSSARELAGPEKGRVLALAGDLENISHGAWPLGLAVKGLLPLEPALASLALDAALAVCEHNPDPAARDRDLAALAPLAARIDLGWARALAAGVADPGKRSRAWLGLARFTNASQDLARAAAAAEATADLEGRALRLARAALACYPARPRQGEELMARAFRLAGTAPDPQRAAWLQGQVAALMVQADPARGWALAGRAPGANGARFKALYQAGAAYLALDPAQGRRALEEALDQARVFAMAYQRCKGYGLAVRAMAPLFRDRARWVLRMIPKQAHLTRAEAGSALAAAGALTDLDRAEAQARDIADPALRLATLARLALIQARNDPAKAAALADRVIVQASRWGALMPRRSLDGLWALLAPARALALAQKLPEPRFRAEALLIQARGLRAKGRPAAAAWRLHLALENLAAMDRGRALAKARLLGDLARRRSSAEPILARGLFRLAARAVEDIE